MAQAFSNPSHLWKGNNRLPCGLVCSYLQEVSSFWLSPMSRFFCVGFCASVLVVESQFASQRELPLAPFVSPSLQIMAPPPRNLQETTNKCEPVHWLLSWQPTLSSPQRLEVREWLTAGERLFHTVLVRPKWQGSPWGIMLGPKIILLCSWWPNFLFCPTCSSPGEFHRLYYLDKCLALSTLWSGSIFINLRLVKRSHGKCDSGSFESDSAKLKINWGWSLS